MRVSGAVDQRGPGEREVAILYPDRGDIQREGASDVSGGGRSRVGDAQGETVGTHRRGSAREVSEAGSATLADGLTGRNQEETRRRRGTGLQAPGVAGSAAKGRQRLRVSASERRVIQDVARPDRQRLRRAGGDHQREHFPHRLRAGVGGLDGEVVVVCTSRRSRDDAGGGIEGQPGGQVAALEPPGNNGHARRKLLAVSSVHGARRQDTGSGDAIRRHLQSVVHGERVAAGVGDRDVKVASAGQGGNAAKQARGTQREAWRNLPGVGRRPNVHTDASRRREGKCVRRGDQRPRQAGLGGHRKRRYGQGDGAVKGLWSRSAVVGDANGRRVDTGRGDQPQEAAGGTSGRATGQGLPGLYPHARNRRCARRIRVSVRRLAAGGCQLMRDDSGDAGSERGAQGEEQRRGGARPVNRNVETHRPRVAAGVGQSDAEVEAAGYRRRPADHTGVGVEAEASGQEAAQRQCERHRARVAGVSDRARESRP